MTGFGSPFIYFSIFPATNTIIRIIPTLKKGLIMKKSTTNKALLMEMLSNEFKKEGGLGVKELDFALRGGSLQEKRQKL